MTVIKHLDTQIQNEVLSKDEESQGLYSLKFEPKSLLKTKK